MPMKKLPYLLLLACLTGCPSAPPKQPVAATTTTRHDARRVGLELLRQAPDTARTWEGLTLLNADRTRDPEAHPPASAEAGKALQDALGLTDEELREALSPTYHHADAAYVAECFLLRDAAHALEVNGATPAELARQAFDWVQRHVLLHEQGESGLPPAQILLRGFGGRADRARVLLALLRQLHFEGGVVVLPDAPGEIRLLAVVPIKQAALPVFLFDSRTGRALLTADGKLATAADVQADASLLQPAGLSAEQWRAAQVRVACPLEAVSPRMAELEFALSVHDRLSVYLNPATVLAKLKEALQRPIAVWGTGAPDDNGSPAPTRLLRRFLPNDEGGVDKTNRQKRFQADLLPWTSILVGLDRLGLGQQLADKEQQPLQSILQSLLDKYDLQPRQMLLRGRGEEVTQRYERLRTFLEDENLSGLAENPDFVRAVGEWREKLHAAYLALANKEPQGQALVNNFWVEDQYLLSLLNVEGEDRLATTSARADERAPPPKKTVLTSIIAAVTRDYLQQRAQWLRAHAWHDKAEREQLRARHITGTGTSAAQGAWINTRLAWNLYLDRAATGPTARQQLLETIPTLLKRKDERATLYAAYLLERLHLDLHQHFAARVNRARALQSTDGAQAAVAELSGVDEEIGGWLEPGPGGQPACLNEIDAVLQRLRGSGRPTVVRSLELLQHDWTPQGHCHWLREAVRAHRKDLQR